MTYTTLSHDLSYGLPIWQNPLDWNLLNFATFLLQRRNDTVLLQSVTGRDNAQYCSQLTVHTVTLQQTAVSLQKCSCLTTPTPR